MKTLLLSFILTTTMLTAVTAQGYIRYFRGDSLKTGVEYDSAKAFHFFADNDHQYGRDSAYIIEKLSVLNQLRNSRQEYRKTLLATPNRILRHALAHLFNKLQDIYGKNPDSALALIRLFYNTPTFNHWIQDVFAQRFRGNNLSQEGRLKADTLLALLMQEKDPVYDLTLKPLQLWALSQRTDDTAGLKRIAAAFERLDRHYLWYGRSARYGMLIYKQLKDAGIQGASDTLLSRIIAQLKQDQADSLPGAAVLNITGDHRMVHKALLASAFYFAYKNEQDDRQKALHYLGQAALYSPLTTKDLAYESFYDQVLLGTKESYRSDFAKALMRNGDRKAALRTLMTTLQANPAMAGQIRSVYDSLAADSTFPAFFMNAVAQRWKIAKDFSLKDRQGKTVTLEDFRGKWLLLDFWGTWCGPCREEMPKVQAFYNRLRADNPAGLSLLTVAAYDTPDKVTAYFNAHHYDLPVVMGDDAFVKDYDFPGFPSMALIFPDGTWLHILFGTDWQHLIGEYMDLYREYTRYGEPGKS